MSAVRTSFEKELRAKLLQKSTAFQSEEAILTKNFRFFDLNNSGTVELNEFIKAVEKIGVQSFDEDQLRDLYAFYDTDKDGVLDYREFSAILFGNLSTGTRKFSPEKQRNVGIDYIETVIDRVKNILAKRGPGGILGLGIQFRIADKNNSRTLDKEEFFYAMRDFGTGLSEKETNDLFVYFDRNKDGTLNFDELIYSIRGKMNNFRRALAEQAFNKIDADASGELTISDLKGVYNASQHPEVKAGRKTEDAVLLEFLKTFECMYDYNRIDDDKVTRDEFIEYYNFISASIDNDQYFELMMNNAWRMNEGANKRWNDKGWGSEQYEKRGEPLNQQQSAGKGRFEASRQGGRGNDRTNYPGTAGDVKSGLEKIRNRLNARGARGFIGLQRQFKIMDDDNDKGISYREFTKALKDYKIDLNDDETRAVFKEFDIDGNGVVSIDEFIRQVRGEMSDFRRNLVTQAFAILDKDKDGVLRVNDIKGVYTARNHPDVKSGKKSEDEILGEFLETFEAHHNLRAGHRDQNVTLNEFIEYYNNVGANIDDDKYFEHMIVTAYKLYANDPKFKEYQPSGYGATKSSWQNDYKSGKVANYAPFGTNSEPTDYNTSSRPQTGQSGTRGVTSPEAYKRSALPPNEQGGYAQQQRPQTSAPTNDYLFKIFRDKIASRGTRGILSISRLFKIIDDDNSKSLNLPEFTKVLKDLRLEFQAPEVKRLFDLFDTNRNGVIDYDEFLRGVRGEMNENRKSLVKLAFKKLDADGSGTITVDDLRGRYNPKNHPDVRSGKKSEDEILAEFLDTFEQHHAVHTGDFKGRNANVTWEEFVEYYNNVGSSIDDDRYFEQMIKTAWNLDNTTYQKGGWKGDKY